jgi:hypothetical protein
MKISHILTSLLVLTGISAGAQDYAFRVLASKGTAEVKSSSGWQPVKVGAKLGMGDELKLPENSYLALVHSTGKPLEIKAAGPYKVSELSKNVSGGASVISKYADFIMSKASDDKNKMTATGAVHRGAGDEVDAYLPDMKNSFIYNSQFTLTWSATPKGGPYEVSIKSQFDDELLHKTTTETQLKVNLDEGQFRDQDFVMVFITSGSEPDLKSEEHLVRRLYAADHDKITKSLAEVTANIKEETALNKFILAGFFEENNLLIDASSAYIDAIRLAPDVPTYKEAYEDFLIRNGMKFPPKK